jgi:DNA-directed RNA polymerase subunit K/omega
MPPKKTSSLKDKDSKKISSLKDSKKNTKKKIVTEETQSETEKSVVEEEEEEEEEETDNDEDVLSSEEVEIDSETENKDCGIDNMIKEDLEFFNEDDSSEIQQDLPTIYLEKSERITNPRLTRYEMVRILGERTKQLTMGAKALVKNINNLSYDEIAIEELKLDMIPIKIKRPLPNNKIEIWDLNELSKIHLNAYIYE